MKEFLVYDELTTSEISFRLGYSSVAHLSAQFKKITGLTPGHFRLLKNEKLRSSLDALKTAFGMSFISMITMEIAMNVTDFALTGGAILTWWVISISLLVGFLTPWPYNYWRLQKFGKSCH